MEDIICILETKMEDIKANLSRCEWEEFSKDLSKLSPKLADVYTYEELVTVVYNLIELFERYDYTRRIIYGIPDNRMIPPPSTVQPTSHLKLLANRFQKALEKPSKLSNNSKK